jgi:hypothetical protein
MPVRWAMPCGIASGICPKPGPMRGRAAGRPGSLQTGLWPPHRRWPRRCCTGPSGQGCPPHGSRATVSRALIGGCGWGWRPSPRPMSWPSRAQHMSGGRGGNARLRPSWPRCLRRAGAGSVRATAPKAPAGMTGAGCPWLHRWRPAGAAGSWSGAV